MKQQQALEIDGITFLREQDNKYGPRWKVFESWSWQEWKHIEDEYGFVENNDFGLLVFNPNIACDYPLSNRVLQAIATFIKQQDERDTANYRLATLGL